MSQLRDQASKLAPTDSTLALATARKIEDPWFACQALAWVARYAPDHEFRRIVEESFRVGRKSRDPYKVVAAAAWPIRAIVEREQVRLLQSHISELLVLAKEIEILASRSEALFLLFQAVFPAGREYWFQVSQSLLEASSPLISWRQRRNLLDAVQILWREDRMLAHEIINGLQDLKLKQKIERAIAKPEARTPRPFFWTS